MVDLDEFIDYYQNVSPSINDDHTFELIVTNVWNLK